MLPMATDKLPMHGRRGSKSSTRALFAEAIKPFQWIAMELERPAMSTYDVVVKRDR